MIELLLDDVSSWPPRLLARFEANERLLVAYDECEKKRMDDKAWGSTYVPMALRPPNPHYCSKQAFLEAIRVEFSDRLVFRGFHCTRLIDDEVNAILKDGMTPPTPAMLERRINVIEQAGLITRDVARLLVRENDAGSPTRSGRTWFIFTKAPLRSKIGVGSLLRYWGGEALYGRHYSNQEIGPMLAGIGTARIIEAAVPLSRMRLISFPGNQMTQQFLATRGVDVSDRDYVDMTELPVAADRIRAVISRRQAAFEALTGCATWRPPLL